MQRGLTEVRAVAARLDELLGHDLFAEVARLQQFPAGSPVLQKRAGYREILPGLGAFPLRPTEGGEGTGAQAVGEFLRDVLAHAASQVTQHERSRWWVRGAHREQAAAVAQPPAALTAPFLTRPPADTPVLLGYVKGGQGGRHLAWIHQQRRYNVRGELGRRGGVGVDSAVLAVAFVLLYGDGILELWRVAGLAEIITRAEMLETGYPSPGGSLYYGLPLAISAECAGGRAAHGSGALAVPDYPGAGRGAGGGCPRVWSPAHGHTGDLAGAGAARTSVRIRSPMADRHFARGG